MLKIKHFIEQSWLLIVASFVFGLLIAVTNAGLEQKIRQNEKDKLDKLMKELITDANDFAKAIAEVPILGKKGKVVKTDIYKGVDDVNNVTGFAFIASGAGFADKIKLVIAVDKTSEKFLGFKVLSSNETPGFGSKIAEDEAESDDDFADQFKGAPAGKFELIKTGKAEVRKVIDSQIVAISGATVSSEAVVKIFNTYFEQVKGKIKELLQKKEQISNDKE